MVLKTMVGQIDVLETMTPTSFASFRARLDTASGFQSAQFRELEFALGYKRESALKHHKPQSERYEQLKKRYEAPSAYRTERGEPGAAGRAHRDLRHPPGRADAPRDLDRCRRRAAGVAVPPREDGRADDRSQTGHRRLAGRQLPKHALMGSTPIHCRWESSCRCRLGKSGYTPGIGYLSDQGWSTHLTPRGRTAPCARGPPAPWGPPAELRS